MTSIRYFRALITFTLEVDAAPLADQATRAAEWVRRVARTIERGDLLRNWNASLHADAKLERPDINPSETGS